MAHKYIRNTTSIRLKMFACFILLLSITTSVWSQSRIVQIDDNKISVKQAFTKIEQQTGYYFFLDQSLLDLKRRIELPATKMGLTEMLDAILKDTGCGYNFSGKNIVIVRKSVADLPQEVKSSQSNAPIITRTISGVVTDDETRRPLMGAKVSVSGVIGTDVETDHAGQFTIKSVPEGIQRIRTYLDGYYLSERGVQISSNTEEIIIPLKTTSVNLGSIRSEADKGGIVTAETSPEASYVVTSISKDTVVTEIPITLVEDTKILTPYLNGLEHNNNTKFGIKTNLLYLASMSPNIGIEWRLGKKWSAEITGGFSTFNWGDNRSINHWLVKPEVRYWLCRPFDGHFFGVHAIIAGGDIGKLPLPLEKISWFRTSLGEDLYRGSAYGGGVTYGYQWAIGRHWNLEAAIGVGFLRLEYDKYSLEEDCKSCYGRNSRNYFGPTKAGISLIYNF